MSSIPAIELKDLSVSINGNAILRNVNLVIPRGDFATVVGPNGGGKTTLLKVILGLLEPELGQVCVFGDGARESRHRVGYVPQYMDFDPEFPVTVRDVMVMGRLGRGIFGRYTSKDWEQVHSTANDLGIEALLDRPFSRLSGGQRQKVLIGRALSGQPEMILLDEPTSNLDAPSTDELYQLLDVLNKKMTVVFVTHDIGFVSRLVRSVICVRGDVFRHPTSDIEGRMICDIYGADMRMIRHDHNCSEEGHKWISS